MNTSLICVQLREILDDARDIKSHSQLHVQHQMSRIHEMFLDVPVGGTGDLIRFPQTEDFYSALATKITSLAFSPEADMIVQISDGHMAPSSSVWYSAHSAFLFIDR